MNRVTVGGLTAARSANRATLSRPAIGYDANGLVPAIVQEQGSGDVLMFAWMNEEALRRSLDTGRMWYWSRSRGELWCKGETSGDRQWVREARYDCDVDVLSSSGLRSPKPESIRFRANFGVTVLSRGPSR